MAERPIVTTVLEDGTILDHQWDAEHPELSTVWAETPQKPPTLQEAAPSIEHGLSALIEAYRRNHPPKPLGKDMKMQIGDVHPLEFRDKATKQKLDIEYVLDAVASDLSVLVIINDDGTGVCAVGTAPAKDVTVSVKAKLKGDKRSRTETSQKFEVVGDEQAVDPATQLPLTDANGAPVMVGSAEVVLV